MSCLLHCYFLIGYDTMPWNIVLSAIFRDLIKIGPIKYKVAATPSMVIKTYDRDMEMGPS